MSPHLAKGTVANAAFHLGMSVCDHLEVLCP